MYKRQAHKDPGLGRVLYARFAGLSPEGSGVRRIRICQPVRSPFGTQLIRLFQRFNSQINTFTSTLATLGMVKHPRAVLEFSAFRCRRTNSRGKHGLRTTAEGRLGPYAAGA